MAKPDQGHILTDRMLGKLEKDIQDEYKQAAKEIQKKMNVYFAEIGEQEQKQRLLLEQGKITEKDFNDWRMRKIAMGKRYEEMRDNLAADMHNANRIAKQTATGRMPDVYALNHNFATYQVEHGGECDTGYILYNRQTVERLRRQEEYVMPSPDKNKRNIIPKDEQWNRRKIQSIMTQSILQGESIPEISSRLARDLSTANCASTIRYARTMTTAAQNAGRQDAFERAEEMGVKMKKRWIATLDDRTRHSHAILHGETIDIDEPFSNGLMYPADPEGDPEEVWNCRCTMRTIIDGFDRDIIKSSPKMGDMSFEEWQAAHRDAIGQPLNERTNKSTFKFTPAKTIEEAEAYAGGFVDKNRFGALGVSYKGVSVDVANEVNKTVGKFFNDYNVEKFGGVQAPAGNTKYGKLIEGATAAYSDVRRSILLNRKSMKNIETANEMLKKEREAITNILQHPERYDLTKASKQLVRILENSKESGRGTIPMTIEEAINHELGHSLEKQIRRTEFYDQIKNNFETYNKKVSGYACENMSEYIAESFCSFNKGEKVIDPVLARAFNSLRR